MSLFETGHSSGEVSLTTLMSEQRFVSTRHEFDIADVVDRIAVGGWPGLLGRDVESSLRVLRGYIQDVQRTDLRRTSGVSYDPAKIGLVLGTSPALTRAAA